MRLLSPFNASLLLWTVGWMVASQAQGAQPADAVPASASIVVRWAAPQGSLEKLAGFVDAVQPGYGEFVRNGLTELDVVPGLKSIDLAQEVWVICFIDPKSDDPKVVFVATATDVDEFKDALAAGNESDGIVHAWGKLVAFSDKGSFDAMELVRKRLDGEGNSFWTTIDAPSKTLFDAADVSVVLNVKQLNEAFTEGWKEEGGIGAFFAQFSDALPMSLPESDGSKTLTEFFEAISKSTLQLVQDSKSWTLGITVTATAIRYEDRLQVVEETETAKFLARQTTGDLSLLGKLPRNKHAYLGIKGDMWGLTEWWMNAMKGLMTELTEDQVAAVDAAAKEMAGQKYEEMFVYFELGEKSPALRYSSISVETPTRRSREISNKLMKAMSEVRTSTGARKQTVELDAVKVGGFPADRLIATDVRDKDPDDDEVNFTKLLNGESEQYLMMYQPNRVLSVKGGIPEMLSLVTALESPRKDSAITESRQRLAEKANVVLLVDVARLIVNTIKLNAETVPIAMDAVNGLKMEPSFLGFAIACEPTAVRMQFEVPILQVQSIKEIVMLFGGAFFGEDL